MSVDILRIWQSETLFGEDFDVLRLSCGVIKGRESKQWQRDTAAESTEMMIREIETAQRAAFF